MAVMHRNGKIILTGKTASSFSRKMKNPDLEVMKKRDAYLKEINKTLKVSRNEKGNVVLQDR